MSVWVCLFEVMKSWLGARLQWLFGTGPAAASSSRGASSPLRGSSSNCINGSKAVFSWLASSLIINARGLGCPLPMSCCMSDV